MQPKNGTKSVKSLFPTFFNWKGSIKIKALMYSQSLDSLWKVYLMKELKTYKLGRGLIRQQIESSFALSNNQKLLGGS